MRSGNRPLLYWGTLGTLLVTCVAAAYYNAADESVAYPDWVIRYTLIWNLVPAAVLVVYVAGTLLTGDHTLNLGRALTMLVLCAAIFISYALNGGSADRDPNNAAQMHLIFVPFLLGVASIPALLLMLAQMIRITWRIRRIGKEHVNHGTGV